MADVHIWEKGEIHCKAVGIAAVAKAVKFNFYKGSDKIGSVDATLMASANIEMSENRPDVGGSPPPEGGRSRRGAVSEGSQSPPTTRPRSNAIIGGHRTPQPPSRLTLGGHRATQTAIAMFVAPEVAPPDAMVKLSYKVEVDGTEKPGFIHDVYVWAKKIKIKSQKVEDGGKLPRAKLKIKQQSPDDPSPAGTSELDRVTDENGELEHDLVYPGEANIAWQLPYVWKEWVTGTASSGRERVAKLERGFIAKLIFPDPAATPVPDPRPTADKTKKQHIQWVNIDRTKETNPKPEWGSKIKIRVGAVNPANVLLNEDKVYLKATFGAKNVERVFEGPLTKEQTEANVQLADPTWPRPSEVKSEEKLITAQTKEVEFELELGPAGGDSVVVEVGGTSECKDAKVEIVNWRLVTYELLYPACVKPNLEEDRPLPLDPPAQDGTPATAVSLKTATTDWVDKELQKGCVAYVVKASHEVGDDHADFQDCLFDSAYLAAIKGTKIWDDGEKVFAAASGWLRREGMWGPDGLRNNQVTCCHVAYSNDKENDGKPKYKPVKAAVSAGTHVTINVASALKQILFKYCQGTGSKVAAVKNVKWRAVVKPEDYPGGHPGLASGAPREGTITVNSTNVQNVDCCKLKIKLPVLAYLGALDATHCPIEVSADVCTAYSINGNSGSGKQLMVVSRPDLAISVTICHELGHSMGMTNYWGPSSAYRKVPPPRGTASLPGVPAGLVYDDAIMHVGTHCAFSIGEDDRKVAKLNDKKGTCIMYGAGGDEAVPTRDKFCPDCLATLKARKLNDICSAWYSRAADDL